MPAYKAANNISYTRLSSTDVAYKILVWITLGYTFNVV